MAIPPTNKRVQLATKAVVNAAIRENTLKNIHYYRNQTKTLLSQRLNELNYEWDTERVLETSAAGLTLLTIGLGILFNKWWFSISALVAFFLLIHALIGWCPPLPIIRRLGVGTMSEINEEKIALKLLRGDFDIPTKNNDPDKLLSQIKLT
ncbi:DUF2892 domain-containing protein [Desulfosporosinus sp. FKA]|uniref:YgaP family membrane protein n=1 Tax=Desulfosporosinus sp. FKA TaxID=1969834 RepID=UPI000B49BBED|nr:DUF2892 domain-containing protein [Desulfosporosinus sp. FKA]